MSTTLKISENSLAKSLAFVSLAGYLICVLGTILFPEFLMTLFNSWFHGINLTSLSPTDGNWVFGTGNLLLGLITFPIFGWLTGYFIGHFYNRLAATE